MKRALLAKRYRALLAPAFAGQTRFTGPNANIRPDTDYRPDAHHRPQRESPAGRGLPPKRNLLARTQFAGTKNKVTEFFLLFFLGPLNTMVFSPFLLP